MQICPCSGGMTSIIFFRKKGGYLKNRFTLCFRPPIVQTSSKNSAIFVWVTLVITFIAYGRFVSLVIRDITNYLGIACFKVGKKKDKKGDGKRLWMRWWCVVYSLWTRVRLVWVLALSSLLLITIYLMRLHKQLGWQFLRRNPYASCFDSTFWIPLDAKMKVTVATMWCGRNFGQGGVTSTSNYFEL